MGTKDDLIAAVNLAFPDLVQQRKSSKDLRTSLLSIVNLFMPRDEADATVAGINSALNSSRKFWFSQTADKTIGNNAALTSTFGTGIGSLTIPAGFWTPGRTVIITGGGVFSTRTLAPGNFTTTALINSLPLASVTISNILAAASNAQYDYFQRICCRSLSGVNAILSIDGRLNYDIGLSTQNKAAMNNGGNTVSVPNNVASVLDVKVQWATADVANTLTVKQSMVEVVN